MVVDDSSDLRNLISTMLEGEGYNVRVADSSVSALKILIKESLDVIVSDYQMPNGSGIELFRAVRDAGLITPFILMSGTRDINVDEMLCAGVSEFLPKPFGRDNLISCLKRVIDLSRYNNFQVG